MTGFAHDPHDREWETGDGYRTVYRASDDYCEDCGVEIDYEADSLDGACACPKYRPAEFSADFIATLKRGGISDGALAAMIDHRNAEIRKAVTA